MIGVFDSGYGGLSILRILIEKLPQYSYLFFGDNGRAPYGNRTPDEIYDLTLGGVDYLFSQGCELVILACNTASALALRRIQQEVLPVRYPDKKVLGIVVPTIEQITGLSWRGESDGRLGRNITVGVLATDQTVQSGAYEKEIHNRDASIKVVQQACSQLAQLIEDGASGDEISKELNQCLSALNEKVPLDSLDAMLLGCTHYELIKDQIRSVVPAQVPIYEQPHIVTESLIKYLSNHSELEKRLDRKGGRAFITSGDPSTVSQHASRFFGQPVTFLSYNS